jgi:multidrug efflux pump subunit AcrA (membrane-fusion protein)
MRIVRVDLEAEKQSLVREGDKAEVELPDGSTIDGRIVDVSKVAESETDPATGEQGDPTISVAVRLVRNAKTGGLDETPVGVSLEKERVENALTVPITALLALAEGGYAVEVVDPGGSTRLVPVDPGMYANGIVAISGDQIREGMRVVVPE